MCTSWEGGWDAAARMESLVLSTNERAGFPDRAKTGQRHGAMTPSLFCAGCAVWAFSLGVWILCRAKTGLVVTSSNSVYMEPGSESR